VPPPKTARIELPSTTARDQSISPQRDSQSSNEKWIKLPDARLLPVT
jgi:hypothetical protein